MKTSRNPTGKANSPVAHSPVAKSLDLALAMVDAEIAKIVAGIAADQTSARKAAPRRRATTKHAA